MSDILCSAHYGDPLCTGPATHYWMPRGPKLAGNDYQHLVPICGYHIWEEPADSTRGRLVPCTPELDDQYIAQTIVDD